MNDTASPLSGRATSQFGATTTLPHQHQHQHQPASGASCPTSRSQSPSFRIPASHSFPIDIQRLLSPLYPDLSSTTNDDETTTTTTTTTRTTTSNTTTITIELTATTTNCRQGPLSSQHSHSRVNIDLVPHVLEPEVIDCLYPSAIEPGRPEKRIVIRNPSTVILLQNTFLSIGLHHTIPLLPTSWPFLPPAACRLLWKPTACLSRPTRATPSTL